MTDVPKQDLSEHLVSKIVDRVVEVLVRREAGTYTTPFCALAEPVNTRILVYYANVVVESVDANGILSLARCLTQQKEIRHLFDIVGFGNRVTLVIHPSLCTMLPVGRLVSLPFKWQASDGRMVHLYHRSVLAYADVCQLFDAILVTSPGTITTMMAREVIQKNRLLWLRSEGTS